MNEAEPVSASTHGSEFSSKFPTTPSPKPSPGRESAGSKEDEDNKNKETLKEPVRNPEAEANCQAETPETGLSVEPVAEIVDSEPQISSDVESSDAKKDPAEVPEVSEVKSAEADPISSLEKITNDQLHASSDSSSLSNTVVIASAEEKPEKDSEEEVLDIQAIEEDVHASSSQPASESCKLTEPASTTSLPKAANKPESSTSTKSAASKARSPPSVAKTTGKSRKPTIPVGIAVAWQRNSATTTTSTSAGSASTTTMSVASTVDGKPFPKSKKLSSSSPPSIQNPAPASTSTPVLGNGSLSPTKDHKSTTTSKWSKAETEKEGHRKKETAVAVGKSDLVTGAKISNPLKNDINLVVANLKSSSSAAKSDESNKHKVKTTTTLSASNKSSSGSGCSAPATKEKVGVVQNNNNASSNSVSERFSASGDGFRSLNNNNSPYRDSWPSSQLLVPQDYAAAAAYLQHQQLSMHQTMQLQLSHSYGYNISSYMYAGYPAAAADSLLQYEQLLRQHQHQQHQSRRDQDPVVELAQRQLLSGNGIRTPIPQHHSSSSNPKISIPTPLPAHSSSSTSQQSLYSHHSLWPADSLYQHYQQQQLIPPPAAHQYQHQPAAHLIQQHMMTTASSTATLSPRSLSSATPSPITIHDSSFQSLLNRKCVTPNPTSKHFPSFSSPFSPTLVPGKDSSGSCSWRSDDGFVDGKLTPIPLVVNSRKKSSTISSLDDIEESRDEETDDDMRKRSRLSSPTTPSMNYKHDFRRLESLIEKRAEESLPLLSSSSESLNANYSQDEGEEEAVNLKVEKDLVVKKVEAVTNCDVEKKSVVPESNSAPMSLNAKGKEIKSVKKSEPKKKPQPQIADDQRPKKPRQKDQLPKKARTEKESKSGAKPKRGTGTGASTGIDHQFDLISKAPKKREAKEPSGGDRKVSKEDTQEINKSRNSTNRSIKKKSEKYFPINSSDSNPLEGKKNSNSRKNPNTSTKLLKKHAPASFVTSNEGVSISGRAEESINYAKDFEFGWNRLTKQNQNQNAGNSSHDIVSGSGKPGQSHPESTSSPKHKITSSTISCDNSSSTFDRTHPVNVNVNPLNVNNDRKVYDPKSFSSPISPNLQYQTQFHPVFNSPQTPVAVAVERRLSSHSHSSGSIESASTMREVFNSLPTIVISPEDNHLNLLATVAAATEEVGPGPFISSRNVSPSHPRRFDIMVSESNHTQAHNHNTDECALRRHSTESLYAAVAAAAAAAAEENNLCATATTKTQETSPSSRKHDERDRLSSAYSNSKALIATSSSQTSNNNNINANAQGPFELKIPLVVPRGQDVQKKKKASKTQHQQEEGKPKTTAKAKGKKEKLDTESKQMRNKKLDSSGQSNSKLKPTTAMKLGKAPQVKKEPKSKISKNSMQRKQNETKKLLPSKTGTAPQNSAFDSLFARLEASSMNANSNSSASIYDFDGFDDTKPERVEPFANRPEKTILQSTQLKKNLKNAGLSATRSGTAGVKKSPAKPGFLEKKFSALKEGRKLVKIKRSGKDDLKTATNGDKRKEILASRKSALAEIAKKRNKTEKMEKPSEDSKSASQKLRKDMNQNVSDDGDKLTVTAIKKKIPTAAAAASKKSTITALEHSTEISPAVGNVNLKNEVVARTLPFLPQWGSHIPRTLTPSSIDPCSSNESSSSAWTTITNPTHIVSAVKMDAAMSIKQESFVGSGEDDSEWPKSPSAPAPRRKMLLKPSKLSSCSSDRDSRSPSVEPVKRMRLLKESSFDRKKFRRSTSPPKRKSSKDSDFKPYLKVEPIPRSSSDDESEEEEEVRRGTRKSARSNVAAVKAAERIKGRKTSIDMNVFSRKVRPTGESAAADKSKEEIWDENVVISGVEDMIDEMRILTEIEGLFYTGKLNALQPPDVYGVTLDNERGAPPHIIFSAEEVISKCIREAKPWKPSQLPHGLRLCAYWSPQYTGLYPGKVSTDYDTVSDLVPVEFDDGDTGVIKIDEIRLLAPNHPVAEYDPNPLLTLEKKHRKRRNSSANGSQGGCTGDHEERDCGEPYCAKVAKLQEEEADDDEEVDEDDKNFNDTYRTKMKYWTWTGLGYKIPKTKKNRHKEFFHGIQRGDEVVNVGDSALFISNGNDRPFIGRIERFWEKKGQKIVNVRWYYHPEEIKTKKRIVVKYPGALFESPHIDENDVQTIAKKCSVLPYGEFKHKYGTRLQPNWKSGGKGASGIDNRKKAPKHTYYVAGFYDPYTFKLQMKDLK